MTAVGTKHTSSYFGDQAQRDLSGDLPHGSIFFYHSHSTFSLTPFLTKMANQFC
jgi:hypothetical protein